MRQNPRQQDSLKQLALSKIKGGKNDLSKDCLGGARQAQSPTDKGKRQLSRLSRTRGDETARQQFEVLRHQVGARLRSEEGKPALRFDPPLEAPSVDPERWAKAEELEGLFWELSRLHGYI